MVVADISEDSANETLGNLPSHLRGQGHMAAVVDVSSKESVKKLLTSIQVGVTESKNLFFFRSLEYLEMFFPSCLFFMQSPSPSAGALLPAALGVRERSRHHPGRLPAQHGGGAV